LFDESKQSYAALIFVGKISMQSKLLLLVFVISMIYSDVQMEQVVAWFPFLALATKWPTKQSHLYNTLLLVAVIQTVAFTAHPVIVNAAVLLAALHNVDPLAGK